MTERPPISHIEQNKHEPETLSLAFELQDSIADRYKSEVVQLPDLLPSVRPEEIENLTEGERALAEKNSGLLRLMNGHRGQALRSLAVTGKSPEAQFLSYILSWSKEAAQEHSIDVSGLVAEVSPEFLSEKLSPEELYERVRFYEKYGKADREHFEEEQAKRTAIALSVEGDDPRWIDIVDVAFPTEGAERSMRSLLENVGSVPTELLNKRRFRGIRAERIVAALKALADIEDKELSDMSKSLREASGNKSKRRAHLDEAASSRELMEMAQRERAKVLNYFFVGRNAEQLRRKNVENITLDSNGLFIKLRGYESHIPYGLITQEMFMALREGGWIDEFIENETSVRMADENTDLRAHDQALEAQVFHFAEELHITASTSEEIVHRLSEEVLADPEEFGKLLAQNGYVIPDMLISNLREKGHAGVSALMAVAESIGAYVTSEELHSEKGGFENYDLLHRTEKAYTARAKVLNRPDYYNVPKIVREILHDMPQSDLSAQFLAFRGDYKKTRGGNQHSFVETIYQGSTSRVLIDRDKHMSSVRREYEQLPLFEREQYMQLERVVQSYDYFKNQVNILRDPEALRNEHGVIEYWQMYRAIESCRQFLLTNVSKYYLPAEKAWKQFFAVINKASGDSTHRGKDDAEIAEELQKLIAIFDEADSTYARFLYPTMANQTNFIETFVPGVEKKDVQFGEDFLSEAYAVCAPDGFSENLCSSGFISKVIQIDHKIGDTSETVPYHIEETSVDRLGIPRRRPLINVIGGARKTTTDPNGANALFASSIVRSAHTHGANVGVPGTQSGIGQMFGEQYLQYVAETEHLADKDKAHYFSVNPGGNTFYPGNPYLKGTPQEEIFAITPVPSIVTPFKAGWELKGREKFDSPYRLHVEHMESLYRRVSDPADRLMVVGNGGLYTLFEVNASIDNNFKLFLVRNTGRFADVASLFSERLKCQDLNPRILNNEEFSKRVIEEVKRGLPEDIAQEFLKKDFGSETEPENEDYEVYRHFFREYMVRVTSGYYTEIRSLDLEDLEEMLSSYFTPAEKKYRVTRFPYETI